MGTVLFSDDLHRPPKPRAGNYFRPRATLGFYLCLAGQIQVKYTFSKLKMEPPRAGCGLRAVMLPPPTLDPLQEPLRLRTYVGDRANLISVALLNSWILVFC